MKKTDSIGTAEYTREFLERIRARESSTRNRRRGNHTVEMAATMFAIAVLIATALIIANLLNQ
jgi:hypothetical protein